MSLSLLGRGAPDREPPAWLCDGLVQVLVRWRTSWPARATSVVAMPSRSHPHSSPGLAAHLASVGRLPVLDALVSIGPAPQADVAASLRAREVETSIAPVPETRVEGVVLLVDDFLRTGWTMTVAGALLRRAGAESVLPLVVHQRP